MADDKPKEAKPAAPKPEQPKAPPVQKPTVSKLQVRLVGLNVKYGPRAGLRLTRQWQPFDLTAEQLAALALDPQVRIKKD